MDMKWLKAAIKRAGLTQAAAEQAVGMPSGSLRKTISGHRALYSSEADNLRRLLGIEAPDQRPPIAVAGRVGAGDGVDLVDGYERGSGLYQIVRPAWVPSSGVVAAEIVGGSAEPWALEGDIVFWRRDWLAAFAEDVGRPVVAETEDGRIMLKRLAFGSKPGLWSLLSINPSHASLFDVPLKWAARAFTPLARDLVERQPD